jgi:hypothetical protein
MPLPGSPSPERPEQGVQRGEQGGVDEQGLWIAHQSSERISRRRGSKKCLSLRTLRCKEEG